MLSADTGYAWSVGSAHKTIAIALGARDGWEPAARHFRVSFDAHMENGDIFGAATVVRAAAALSLRVGNRQLADQLWMAFPTHLGRSVVAPAFGEEEHELAGAHGVRAPADIAGSVRAVRALLGGSVSADSRTHEVVTVGRADDSVVRFEDCELDLGRYELRRRGTRIPVEPQVFDVLSFLVQHRSRLVPKEELLDEIWGDRFVSESTLTSRIKAARQATGDDGEAQRVIRTVRGRGYMFVATVVGDEEPVSTDRPRHDGPGTPNAG